MSCARRAGMSRWASRPSLRSAAIAVATGMTRLSSASIDWAASIALARACVRASRSFAFTRLTCAVMVTASSAADRTVSVHAAARTARCHGKPASDSVIGIASLGTAGIIAFDSGSRASLPSRHRVHDRSSSGSRAFVRSRDAASGGGPRPPPRRARRGRRARAVLVGGQPLDHGHPAEDALRAVERATASSSRRISPSRSSPRSPAAV